jgi:REP element-mobilizing transposase RayT
MVRKNRINIPFCLYHVFSRTNSGGLCFYDEQDQDKFLDYLAKYLKLLSFRIHAWCFMPNHFHLLIESNDSPGLSMFMHHLLTAYTVYFNHRHDKHGHLFQGRFKSLVVDKSDYLLEVSRYIHLNPKLPESYTGSSLRYYIHGDEPDFLYTKETLSWFKGNREKYAEFVREGFTENITPEVLKQRYIGGKAFAERMEKRLNQASLKGSRGMTASILVENRQKEKNQQRAEILLNHTAKHFPIPWKLIPAKKRKKGEIGKARTILINLLHFHLPWTYQQIAEYMEIQNNSVIRYHIRKLEKDKNLYLKLEKIEKELTIQ